VSERLIADENFSVLLVQMLRADGLDIVHVREIMPGAPDPDVVAEAHRRDAILLTFDRGFGDLVVRHRQASVGIVLFRLRQQKPDEIVSRVRAFFVAPPPLRGRFTVVSGSQVRQRPLLHVVDDET